MFSSLSSSELLILLGCIVVALSFHEAMHGFAAHWLGDTTAQDMGRLTLNPLKHIDLITTVLLPLIMLKFFGLPFFAAKPVPFNPDRVKYDEYGVAIIGLAGPLTNLLLAVLSAILIRSIHPMPGSLPYNVIIDFTEVNIGFFIFNMIPFPPLDGSRLLYAVAPEGLQNIMRQIESYGFMSIIFFVLIIYRFISGPIDNIENTILNFLL